MDRFFGGILRHRGLVIALFLVGALVCAVLGQWVSVNYDMIDYLPADTPSTIAIEKMGETFPVAAPNARLMVGPLTIPQAVQLRQGLLSLPGVTAVSWLSDMVDVESPLALLPDAMLERYYRDEMPLYTLTMEKEGQAETLDTVRLLAEGTGTPVAIAGSAVNSVGAMSTAGSEVLKVTLFVIPLCLIILLATSTSLVEPILFLGAIGVAVLLNRGTNLILGEISFVTNAAAAILQLAVSMDYSIFLLHRFNECRQRGLSPEQAMVEALKSACSTITASALTTAIGFAALILMRFRLGSDMGIVMAKAILLSMGSVLVFLPALTLTCTRWIDKTRHRSWMPHFGGFSKAVVKMRIPMLVLFLLILIPSYFAQQSNQFTYGASSVFGEETTINQEQRTIEGIYGTANQLVLLVPDTEPAREKMLSDRLAALPAVSSVLSYTRTIGETIPQAFVPTHVLSQFISGGYSRILMTLDAPIESDIAFATVDQVRALAGGAYPDQSHLAGDSATTRDLKAVTTSDMSVVNAVAIAAVFLVLLLSLRSVLLPFLLVLVIEAAIWVNMAIPYFSGQSFFYIGYMIVSAVQLGATVDFAILLTHRYLDERKVLGKRDALLETLTRVSLSILTSASIMTLGGVLMGFVSTNTVIRQMGTLIGRGAVLSAAFVLLVLPALLYLLDALIPKLSWGIRFRNTQGKGGIS